MTYPGGKAGSGAAHRIITLMPPHSTYIEPFCGSAAVARLKKPAKWNILLDLDDKALTMARDGSLLQGLEPEMAAERFQGRWTTVLGDGLDFLEHHSFDGTELVYCDPPYMRETRKSAKDLYRFEWTDHHHSRLLKWAAETKARVILSGYHSRVYDMHLSGGFEAEGKIGPSRRLGNSKWWIESFQAMTRRGVAVETLWWNFERPTVLHDDRYLGDGFRERERIRRRQKRWVARLQRMDPAERNAILGAVRSLEP